MSRLVSMLIIKSKFVTLGLTSTVSQCVNSGGRRRSYKLCICSWACQSVFGRPDYVFQLNKLPFNVFTILFCSIELTVKTTLSNWILRWMLIVSGCHKQRWINTSLQPWRSNCFLVRLRLVADKPTRAMSTRWVRSRSLSFALPLR